MSLSQTKQESLNHGLNQNKKVSTPGVFLKNNIAIEELHDKSYSL